MELLNLGEFEGAVDSVLSWFKKVLSTLNQPAPLYSDPKTIETEISRLRVIT